ncbi:MAG: hypothetical protein LQ344_004349 [Seirophora lacunosa]|nr:MAG: hypothetical protein LQ344_004349 [Seirophora lacunosa]
MPSDDTSVAVLETAAPGLNYPTSSSAQLHFHEKVTADNAEYRGIHPMVSLQSHNAHLAPLIVEALRSLPPASATSNGCTSPSIPVRTANQWVQRKKPDFISITRGPGLLPSLSTGLQTAKGLAVAWQVPLLGINHMQAHALTPRLVHALESSTSNGQDREPAFPFLTLLVSGGHTMLVHSKALTHHSILAGTTDIAVGDAIDKAARCILPQETIAAAKDVMYGRLLEEYAAPPRDGPGYDYLPPRTRAEELTRKPSQWGWALAAPLAETRSGSRSRAMEFSFSGLGSAVLRICQQRGQEMTREERVDLAREVMRVAFEHLASRVVMALESLRKTRSTDVAAKGGDKISTLVVSGGVASNGFLKKLLRSFLDIRGYSHIRLLFPPPSLCTDNAAMIAWTGIEMYEAGYESDLGCNALRRWSIDPNADDGGILGASGNETVQKQ